MIGETISHYEILAKLGGGGMGVVYKARHLTLDRLVALKFLPTFMSADQEAKERFIHEAKAASALDHTNICAIHDIAETEKGELYIVMAYYDGQTLKARLSNGALPVELAVDLSKQLARALERAHEARIVHRDIKPANIMLTERGELKLLDFGLAKLTGGADLTKTGSTLGTASYMSPEQVRGEAVGPASDIWSLGVVMYEMLTGSRPFEGSYEQAIGYAIMNEEPPSLRELQPGVPEAVAAVVEQCLKKDVASRPASAKAVISALDTNRPAAAGRRTSYRTVAITAAVASVAIVAGAITWAILSGEPSETPAAAFRITPVTQHEGNEINPQLSADGSQIAYSWRGPDRDNLDLYVQRIGDASYARLTGDTLAESAVAWSPDGNEIAFVRTSSKSATIWLKAVTGGLERKVADLRNPLLEIRGGLAYDWNLIWHPQGEWIVANERMDIDDPAQLIGVSVRTGEKVTLTSPGDTGILFGDRPLSFSNDGKTLLFDRLPDWSSSTLFVLKLTTDLEPVGKPQKVFSNGTPIYDAEFVPGANEIVFSSADAIWLIPADGSSRPTRLERTEGIRTITISSDGRRLAYQKEMGFRSELWSTDLRDSTPESERHRRLTSGSVGDIRPRFSPDGQRLAFVSNRSGRFEVWISSTDGSELFQLTEIGDCNEPYWAPDGESIVFECRGEGGGQADLYVARASGGEPQRLTTDPSDDVTPSWSHDGQTIYFASQRGSDAYHIWKMNRDGTNPEQVTDRPGWYTNESADGRYVYYSSWGSWHKSTVDRGAPDLWRVGTDGTGTTRVVADLGDSAARFDIVGDGIYYIQPADDRRDQLWRVDLDGNNARPVTPLYGGRTGWGLSVSPDLTSVVYHVPYWGTSDLYLIDNFR